MCMYTVHRVGQQRETTVHWFCVEQSVEVAVQALAKQTAISATVKHSDRGQVSSNPVHSL